MKQQLPVITSSQISVTTQPCKSFLVPYVLKYSFFSFSTSSLDSNLPFSGRLSALYTLYHPSSKKPQLLTDWKDFSYYPKEKLIGFHPKPTAGRIQKIPESSPLHRSQSVPSISQCHQALMYNQPGSCCAALSRELFPSEKPSGPYLTSHEHHSIFSSQSSRTPSLGSFDFCFRLRCVCVIKSNARCLLFAAVFLLSLDTVSFPVILDTDRAARRCFLWHLCIVSVDKKYSSSCSPLCPGELRQNSSMLKGFCLSVSVQKELLELSIASGGRSVTMSRGNPCVPSFRKSS